MTNVENFFSVPRNKIKINETSYRIAFLAQNDEKFGARLGGIGENQGERDGILLVYVYIKIGKPRRVHLFLFLFPSLSNSC